MRSLLMVASALVVLVTITLPQITTAVQEGTVKPATLVYNGKLTICKLDKSDYHVVKTVKMSASGYNSLPDQTDSTPFITASNKHVADGIVANNGLPFGTKVRMPEIFGEKVFTVEDRMHPRMGTQKIDIWFAEYADAIKFGRKTVKVEILEN